MVGFAESKFKPRTAVWPALFYVFGAFPILLCRGLFPDIFENPPILHKNMKISGFCNNNVPRAALLATGWWYHRDPEKRPHYIIYTDPDRRH